jgi:hypothetical protein
MVLSIKFITMNYSKTIKYLLLISVVAFFASCSKDEDIAPVNELENLQLATTITNDQHKIELYTANGKFQTGYNAIFLQIKKTDGSLVNKSTVTWTPVMRMMSLSHSCPYSTISMKENAQSTYAGYIVFQMAGSDLEPWDLTLNYTVNGTSYTAKSNIKVTAAPKRVVESFQGSDGKRYVIAMVKPVNPKVATNDMTALVYRMESMMNFVPVSGYTVKIDPRMPGMGNHGSPNNIDLTHSADGRYSGKLSLTMTGYWKINLQLLDSSQNVLKGEEVTSSNESSSIYFELEF